MKKTKILSIKREKKQTYDITVNNNHNFFCNNHLIHNCDYRGEVGLIIVNTDPNKLFEIRHGDRLGQGVLNQVEQIEWEKVYRVEDLGETVRGEGGFGHTGKN